jgi:glycolate oxidase FAD binding subunit
MTTSVPTRPGREADAVDGVGPGAVAEPDTPAALAAALAAASTAGQATVLRGGGSKLAWGRPPARVDLVIATGRLAPLLVHRDGDLTVTVGAGVTLADLNRHLAQKGQWLPIDSAFPSATIGGVLSTNDAGPVRHRHGTPRDLLIGITLALTDGRLVKAGGTVVKNVAGYDLGKLVSGSFGALAAIVDATFKLLPVPHASRTLVVSYDSPDVLAANVATLAASQLEPLSCDVQAGASHAPRLLLRFASSPASTHAQVAAARTILGGQVSEVSDAVERECWQSQVQAPWTHDAGPAGDAGDGAVIRLSWMPARLAEVLHLVRDLGGHAVAVTLHARAIVGTGLMSVRGTAREQAAVVERLRASDMVGHVVVLRGSRALKDLVDVWGSPVPAQASLLAIKRSFDPAGILNAARGPV